MNAVLAPEELEEVKKVFDLETDNVLVAILHELEAIRLLNQGQTWLLRFTTVSLAGLAGLNVAGKIFGF